MKKTNKKIKIIYSGGFAALMSVIIISAILLLIASTLSFSGFSARYNILDSEYKERSLGLAEACVDNTLLQLTLDPTYSGGLPDISVGADKCTVRPFNPALDPITLETTATFGKAVTNLHVVVDKTLLSVISWEELP